MADYQVIVFRDSAPLTTVGMVPGSPVPTLELQGSKFGGTVEVLINGVRSPEFVVLSGSRIWAQIPRSQVSRQLHSLAVLSASAGNQPSSVVSFRASAGRFVAEGRVKLVQTYLKILLTTPGTDVWYPWMGGGLQGLIGTYSTEPSIRAAAERAVTQTEQHMVRIQATSSASDTERLASARLQELTFSPSTASLSLTVRLVSLSGLASNAGLAL